MQNINNKWPTVKDAEYYENIFKKCQTHGKYIYYYVLYYHCYSIIPHISSVFVLLHKRISYNINLAQAILNWHNSTNMTSLLISFRAVLIPD
jgi:hypothetical protein